MAIIQKPKLFKTDSKGEKTLVWYAEIDGDKIRTISGILDGSLTESGWKLMKAKNVGKANESTPEEQAETEVAALYEKKLAAGGYFESEDAIGGKTYTHPMLAQKYADVGPIDFDQAVFSQPKLDGFRCIANKDGMWTRKGKRFVTVPHIEFSLIELFRKYPDLQLDGELYNHEFHDDFNKISSLVAKKKPTAEDLDETEKLVQYHVYDIVDEDKVTLDRQQMIFDLFEEFKSDLGYLVRVDTTYVSNQEELDQLYGEYLELGYEGQMVRYNRKYKQNHRANHLIKRKQFEDEEVDVLDIIEGEGNWAGAAKSLTIRLKDGIECSSGIKGNKAFLVDLLVNKHLYLSDGCEATIRFPNKTPAGKPRFPSAVAIWRGKRDS